MRKAVIEAIQRRLRELGNYTGDIDGDRGEQTDAAAAAHLATRPKDVPADVSEWSGRRKTIGFLQVWCLDVKIDAGDIDGYWGPQTDYAAEALLETLETGKPPETWRDEIDNEANPNGWPKQDQSSLIAFYGPHGNPKNKPSAPPPPRLKRVPSPWRLKIAWNKRLSRTSYLVNEKVADSLATVIENVHSHYGEAEIEKLGLDLFGGDYNARRMRGGSRMSTHSWGIAIDFDPEANQLKWGRDRARMAGPDYSDWWGFWEAEGWVSLGRARNFDWMHVQAARL